MLKRLEIIFKDVCEERKCELLEFGAEKDHVHILVASPPQVQLSDLVKSLKGVSSRYLRREFWPEIKGKLWGDRFWSPSYCAVSCGGAPLDVIKKYIQDQDAPPSERSLEMQRRVSMRKDRN